MGTPAATLAAVGAKREVLERGRAASSLAPTARSYDPSCAESSPAFEHPLAELRVTDPERHVHSLAAQRALDLVLSEHGCARAEGLLHPDGEP